MSKLLPYPITVTQTGMYQLTIHKRLRSGKLGAEHLGFFESLQDAEMMMDRHIRRLGMSLLEFEQYEGE